MNVETLPPLPGGSVSLQTRVVNILKKPAAEWQVIAGEPRDVAALYRNYIVLLAAIPVVCNAIGGSIIGRSLPLIGYYRTPIVSGLAAAVFSYLLSLIGIYVSAVIVARLAPTFQSEPSVPQALKLLAYSSTPMWVAGVLNLVPALGVLAVFAGLYGCYVAYLGMSPVMKTPPDKVIVYMIVAAIVMIAVVFVASVISGLVLTAVGLSLLG